MTLIDTNKDEALRCVRFAEEAIASGNKEKALKFINIARRLHSSLSLGELLLACHKLNNEEHMELVARIKGERDYYAILGVGKTSSFDEIKRAYKKLSLKVHPDKNKAPGSEEAFKKLCKAFECLSDGDSRRQYDSACLVDEKDRRCRFRRSRRRRNVAVYDDNRDFDNVFRPYFERTDVYRDCWDYTGSRTREEFDGGGPNLILLLQILPFVLIILLAYLPFSEPVYSLHKNVLYQIPRTTEKYNVEFFVRTSTFDEDFPLGSPPRATIEDSVIREFKYILVRNCRIERQRRRWVKDLPTPNCVKLQDHGLA